jgi:hypothetical protein
MSHFPGAIFVTASGAQVHTRLSIEPYNVSTDRQIRAPGCYLPWQLTNIMQRGVIQDAGAEKNSGTTMAGIDQTLD